MAFLYHQDPKVSRWSVTSLTFRLTISGSFTMNGKRLTVSISYMIGLYYEYPGILGDMMYFNVLGQPFLVLGSLQRTTDLFEKRSSNYSDRMRLPMLVELCVLYSFTSQPFKLF